MAFLVFEGIDGSGKSTLMQAVLGRMSPRLSLPPLATREPGGSALGERLRTSFQTDQWVPAAELLFILALRAQHVREVLKPAQVAGRWIFCDRFSPSTMAFQVAGRGLDADLAQKIDAFATDGLKPDLVIWVDTPIDEARARIEQRAHDTADRFEGASMTFLESVYLSYQIQYEAQGSNWLRLDGSLPAAQLVDQVEAYLLKRFGTRL